MVKVLIFGTGSVGSVYACTLSRAGAELTCVCRSDYEPAKLHGLKVSSAVFGEMHARPEIVRDVADAIHGPDSHFDFVLVCSKATPQTTWQAIKALEQLLTTGTTTLVIMQNGLGVEEPFRTAFPSTPIISGVIYLPVTRLAPAVFSHGNLEVLHLGTYPAEPGSDSTPSHLTSLAQLFKSGGATVEVHEDVQVQRWRKMVTNGALNPMCALSRCGDRQLCDISPLAVDLFRGVMREIAAVAASEGYGDTLTEAVVEEQLTRTLERATPGVQTSMMADALAARPMEVETIVGELVRMAGRNGVDVPRLTTLYILLKGLDGVLQGGGYWST